MSHFILISGWIQSLIALQYCVVTGTFIVRRWQTVITFLNNRGKLCGLKLVKYDEESHYTAS